MDNGAEGTKQNAVGKDQTALDVLHEFPPIHEWDSGGLRSSLIARVVRRVSNGKVLLDIRERVDGDDATFYTKRGLRLSLTEILTIQNHILPSATDIILGARRERNSQRRREACKSSSATSAEKQTGPNRS